MKNINTLCLILVTTSIYTQVGIGNITPRGLIDVNDTINGNASAGFVLPHTDNPAQLENPQTNAPSQIAGTIAFDKTDDCIKFIKNDGTWSECIAFSPNTTNNTIETNCDSNGFEGNYTFGVPLISSDNKFSVTITNNTSSAISIPVSASDLTLSGVTGISVESTAPSGDVSLAANDSLTISYIFTGTPAIITNSDTLTASWLNGSFNCTKNRFIGSGTAIFTNARNNAFLFSVNDVSNSINSQGTLSIGTTVNIPYTSGSGSYASYSSPEISIDPSFSEDGANDWTFSYNYSAGTFSTTGNLVATLVTKKAGVVTPWPAKRVASINTINFDVVSLPLVVNGNSLTNTVGVDTGGDAIRGALVTAGCASCPAYDAASDQSWVVVTQGEYNQFVLDVQNTVRGGIQEANYASATTSNHDGNAYILQVDNGSSSVSVPSGYYIYAFKIRFLGGSNTTHNNLKFFDGPSNSRTMTQLGPNIPTFTAGAGVQYFVYKRNVTRTVGARSLGLHSPSQNLLGLDGTTINIGSVSPANLNFSFGIFGISLQGLATDIKQW